MHQNHNHEREREMAIQRLPLGALEVSGWLILLFFLKVASHVSSFSSSLCSSVEVPTLSLMVAWATNNPICICHALAEPLTKHLWDE